MQVNLEKKNPFLDCRHDKISATLNAIIYCIECLEIIEEKQHVNFFFGQKEPFHSV